jgi:uncharacterized protein
MDRVAVYREGSTGEAVACPFDDVSLASASAVAAFGAAIGPDPIREPVRRPHAEALERYFRFTAMPLWARLALSAAAMAAMLAFAVQHLPGTVPWAAAVVFVAASLSSIGGFAFAALCGAPLFHLMPPVMVVQVILVCSIAIQSLSVIALRKAIDWPVLIRFLMGGVTSLPIGVYLLLHLDPELYCRLLGVFLIVYGAFMVLRPHTTVRFQPVWSDLLVGLIGGITGGFAGFPGAFVTIWCSLKGWNKDRQRSVYQPFILVMQILTLGLLSCIAGGSGSSGGFYNLGAWACVLPALLGTWCGLGWYRRLSDAQFAAVVNALLIASGAGLVF